MSMTRPVPFLAVALTVALAAAGCSDPAVPAAPTPVAPTITDTFTGTLLQLETNSHPFAVQQVGGIKVTISSVQPSAAVQIGIGTPSSASGTCLVLSSLTVVASEGAQISGTATVSGNFCVAVADVGNLVEPVNYTITVLHS
jgi:hypothetical protein